MAYVPQANELEVIGAGADAAPIGAGAALNPVRRRFLRVGRILVTGGWLVLINTTIGNRAANAEHALVGLALLLLGVFLIVLSPVADQFPGAARVGAVLFYLFAPGN